MTPLSAPVVESTRPAAPHRAEPRTRIAVQEPASLRFSAAEIELLRREFAGSARWRDVLVEVGAPVGAR